MINLNEAVGIFPTRGRNYDDKKGAEVRIAIHHQKHGNKNNVNFSFYGERVFKIFDGHGIVPYIYKDKIVFAIDDENGYTFSIPRSAENAKIKRAEVKIINNELLLFCVNNEGCYKLKYDYDSKLYYINMRERL